MVVDEVLLLGRTKVIDAFFEHIDHLRQIFPKSFHDAVQGPEEDAAVPEKVAFSNKLQCRLVVGFLLEHFHFHHLWKCGINFAFSMRFGHLDVTITRLWSTWFDADGHQCVLILCQEVESQTDDALELRFVGHQVVGGGDDDVGLLAAALDVIGRVGNARCRVATCRLTKHLVIFQHRQMLQYEMLVCLVGHHEEILIGDNGAETFVGAADKALSCAEYIEELFRIVVFAKRPEAAPDAAGHDDAIVVVHGIGLLRNDLPFTLR